MTISGVSNYTNYTYYCDNCIDINRTFRLTLQETETGQCKWYYRGDPTCNSVPTLITVSVSRGDAGYISGTVATLTRVDLPGGGRVNDYSLAGFSSALPSGQLNCMNDLDGTYNLLSDNYCNWSGATITIVACRD